MNNNKKRNILFVVIIIIILCITGGYLFHDESKNDDNNLTNEQENINNKYKIVSYYGQPGEYFIEKEVESDKNWYIKIYKIDSSYNSKEIYNSKEKKLFWYNIQIFEYDKNKYVIMGYDDINKKMKLYKFDENNNSLNEFFSKDVINFHHDCSPIKNNYVIGVAWGEDKNRYYYLFDKNEIYEIKDDSLFMGDHVRLADGDSITTSHEKNYIRLRKHFLESGYLFGLYDIENNKKIIDTKYDKMVYAYSDYYIVEKNGKAGVIDSKENILVDFEYDYIVPGTDYLLVAKNKKIAVMNKDFKLITNFEFNSSESYQYDFCCGDRSNIESIKINNNIILYINPGEVYTDPWNSYIIFEDGTYKNIDEYKLINNYNDEYELAKIKDGMISIHDINLNKKFDLIAPNITKNNEVYILKNAYFIYNDKNFYFFDKKTGQQITEPYNINEDLYVKYNISPSTDSNEENIYYDITFYNNEEIIYTDKKVLFKNLKYIYNISKLDNDTYYYGDYEYDGSYYHDSEDYNVIIKKNN